MIGVRLIKAQQISNKLYQKYHGETEKHEPNVKILDFKGSFKKVRKPCSCYVCGNPRKWFKKLTRQEKISAIDHKEQMLEISYVT